MMVFKRISAMVNPYAEKLFDYPGEIFPFFEAESDKAKLKSFLKNLEKEVFLEYGSGSGSHLLSLAQFFPEIICLGFEIRFKRAVRTIEKAKELKISNVIIARTRGEIAADLIDKEYLKGIFINFPDPWEKKRWLKHRILTKNRIEEFLILLKKGGFISIKTDHANYFNDFIIDLKSSLQLNEVFEILEETSDLERNKIKFKNSLEEGFSVSFIETEFEKLFRGQNKKINYCLIRKI
jgi:tRNA (guanine-N7-)-methyltransferase